MIKVVIASDIRLYLEVLERTLKKSQSVFKIIGSVESYDQMVMSLDRDYPEVVLVDLRAFDDHISLACLPKNYKGTKFVLLGVPEDIHYIQCCVESGITGYLSKEATVEEVIDAIKTVYKGSLYCPSNVTEYIVKSINDRRANHQNGAICQQSRSDNSKRLKFLDLLTQRETEIIILLAEGKSNKQIAKALTIELSTVKNHVHNILVKTGVDSRTQAASLFQGYTPIPAIP